MWQQGSSLRLCVGPLVPEFRLVGLFLGSPIILGVPLTTGR